MNSKNSSTKKSVNRARKSNGSGNKPRPSPNQQIGSRRDGNGGVFPRGVMSSAPVAVSRGVRTARPKMTTKPNGDCRIRHREYIQEIARVFGNSPVFSSDTSLPINPGQAGTFPWLSKIAANFESYRFNNLKFDYETELATSVAGSNQMAVDYDASDGVPTSKLQIMAFRNSVRSALWAPSSHVSDREDLQKKKMYYVRPGAQPANTDIKEYDVGKFFSASTSSSLGAGTILGELYVEYDVDLMTPLYQVQSGDAESFSAVGTTGQAAATPFGTPTASLPVPIDTGQPLTVMTIGAAGTFTFQRAFSGLLVLEYIGTVISAVAACTGTATIVQLGASADVGALKATQAISIVAVQGQTVVLGALTATTVTSAIARFSSYPVVTLA